VTFETTIDVRYRDIDAMGHVNNAVYASYLEQARINYFQDLLGVDLSAVGAVLATITIEYERPVELSDGEVRVELDVPASATQASRWSTNSPARMVSEWLPPKLCKSPLTRTHRSRPRFLTRGVRRLFPTTTSEPGRLADSL